VRNIAEIEKALAGSGSGGNLDSGVMDRFLGAFLYWLQEKTAPVYVIATSNNVGQLPPELLRAGRWDGLWFVDLPTEKERAEIFSIHIGKSSEKRLKILEKDMPKFVAGSEGLTGAEIEGSVQEALRIGFKEDREINAQDVLTVLASAPSLMKMKEHELKALIEWAEKVQARRANTPDKVADSTASTKRRGRKGVAIR
jgi:SpoVK/Ycf46/Vps4 family AAA+-type ATPase